jgi:hypothetical protein
VFEKGNSVKPKWMRYILLHTVVERVARGKEEGMADEQGRGRDRMPPPSRPPGTTGPP